MVTRDSDLSRVRRAITELIRNKYESGPRGWSEVEVIRYRNLCELEEALSAVERLEAAAS
jgi:hypothetical protein